MDLHGAPLRLLDEELERLEDQVGAEPDVLVPAYVQRRQKTSANVVRMVELSPSEASTRSYAARSSSTSGASAR